MSHPIKYLLIPLFVGITYCQAQDSTSKHFQDEIPKGHDFSFRENWKYFEFKDTLTGIIIEHYPADAFCGVVHFKSLSIIKLIKGDTIRVIESCNLSKYAVGQKVRIIPAERQKSWAGIPFTLVKNKETGEFSPISSDLTVFKTTFGYIVPN